MNRIVCRLSLRDLKRGSATFGPLRVPFIDAKKFEYAVSKSLSDCCSTTAETSPSQARASVFFASVMTRLDRSPTFGYGKPWSRTHLRARNASLNTTRAHPNALPSAAR